MEKARWQGPDSIYETKNVYREEQEALRVDGEPENMK